MNMHYILSSSAQPFKRMHKQTNNIYTIKSICYIWWYKNERIKKKTIICGARERAIIAWCATQHTTQRTTPAQRH